MKKILMSIMAAMLIFVPVSFANAQELTRDDVITVAPQFALALGSMQNGLNTVRMQIISENVALSGISNVLSLSLVKLSNVEEPLSDIDQVEVNRVETELGIIQNQVNDIVTRRQNIQNILDNISDTLVAISEAIAEAA